MPYIYQADCWCDSCGESIRNRLLESATDQERNDWQDERAYDSDDFPKYMGDDGESDNPQHCGSGPDCLEYVELPDGRRIGSLLSTSLTSEGVNYVLERVAGDPDSPVCQFWREQFSWIDWPEDPEDDPEDD